MAPELSDWPELPLESWRDTRDTLHMQLQVIGKVRLALAPMEPQWGQVPLYVTARGLTTSPIAHPTGGVFDVEVDLVDHRVDVRTARGKHRTIGLRPRSVAEFHAVLLEALDDLGLHTEISDIPSEVPDPIPFARDTTHAAYERSWANRFFRVLASVDAVMKEHRAGFVGRTSAVQLFWGTFDLALTRYNGKPAEPPPAAGPIVRRSADAEQISVGFWPGSAELAEPAFFAFAYPKPDGIEDAVVAPDAAGWDPDLGELILPYAAVQSSSDPRAELLTFMQSSYEALAAAAGWDQQLVTG